MADEKLQIVRHSCAHVMAEAIKHLFPGTKIAIGPAIDNGFYYDFDFGTTKISDTDFPAIEKEMRKILAGNHDFVRKEVSKEEALKLFADEPYKVELINDLPDGETITTYEQDGYLDLCRGPHVANTKEINGQAFKLDKIAGAYWRGDEHNKMLTRLYATAFAIVMNICWCGKFFFFALYGNFNTTGKAFGGDYCTAFGLSCNYGLSWRNYNNVRVTALKSDVVYCCVF